MESKKVRLGSGKKRNETWITATLCMSDAKEYVYSYNGKDYVNLNINIGKMNEYGKDIQITLNDYKKSTEADLSTKI